MYHVSRSRWPLVGGATSNSLKVSLTLEDIIPLQFIIITNLSIIIIVLFQMVRICDPRTKRLRALKQSLLKTRLSCIFVSTCKLPELFWSASNYNYVKQLRKMSRFMTKPTKWHVRSAKTQISLGIRPAWSESSLCAQWVAKDASFLHADSEDWSGRMPSWS